MVDLPNLSVTQAQADRITAAFQNEADENGQPLTPQQAYRRWSFQMLRAKVLQVEGTKIDVANNKSKRDALSQIEQGLP